MDSFAIIILQLGLGITFIWMSILIFRDPMRFGKLILPWAQKLTPMSIPAAMKLTAVFDLMNGIWLLTGIFTWIAALFAALHLLQVLLATGARHGTFRDFGLMFASIALMLLTLPEEIRTLLPYP